MTSAPERTVDEVLLLSTLSILQLIKDAQQQHGLRHGDYQRYRAYCTRRIRRLRKSLNFTNVQKYRSPFQSKVLTPEVVTDSKFLVLPLVQAERCWAYAMQLKQEANSEPRKKFHLLSKLRKAVKYAAHLESLCKTLDTVDARSKLEAQAYHLWLQGTLQFDLQNWQNALEFFNASKKIYEKLGLAIGDQTLGDLYKQRCAEMEPQLRYCRYNIGDKTEISDIMQMKLQISGADSDNLDALIAQALARQSAEVKAETQWCGNTVVLEKPMKVRSFFSTLQSFDQEIKKIDNYEAKNSLFERLLIDCRDAIQAVRDEAKGENLKTRRVQDEECPMTPAQLLHSYLTYIRLTKTIERYIVMIEATVKEPVEEIGEKADKKGQTEPKRGNKPQDIARLYDTVLQDLGEIQVLPGCQSDEQFLRQTEALIVYYKTFRCFYVAESFATLRKWRESAALFDRASEYLKEAKTNLKLLGTSTYLPMSPEALENLAAKITASKYAAFASSISAADEPSVASSDVTSKPLFDEMEKFYTLNPADLTAGKLPTLVQFPPDFEAIPCKPLFFDLALNHLHFPSLEHHVETERKGVETKEKGAAAQPGAQEQPGGLGNLVKGWFWGKK